MPVITECPDEGEDAGHAAFHFDPRAADEALAAAEREAAALRAAGDAAGAERALRATTVAGVLETLRERDGADGEAFAGVYATVLGPSLRLRLGTDSWPEHYRAHLARMTYATLRARGTDLDAEARGAYGLDEREALALRPLRDSAFLPTRRAVLAAFGFADPLTAPSSTSSSSTSESNSDNSNNSTGNKQNEQEQEGQQQQGGEKEKDKDDDNDDDEAETEAGATKSLEEAEKEAVKRHQTPGELVRGLVPRHTTRARDAGAARRALQALERAQAAASVLCEPPGGSEGAGLAWRRTPVAAVPDRRDVFWRFCADRRAPQYEVLTAEYVGALAAYIARRVRELAHRCPEYLSAKAAAAEAAKATAGTGPRTGARTRKVFEFCVLDAGAGSGRLGHFLQEGLARLLGDGDVRVRVRARRVRRGAHVAARGGRREQRGRRGVGDGREEERARGGGRAGDRVHAEHGDEREARGHAAQDDAREAPRARERGERAAAREDVRDVAHVAALARDRHAAARDAAAQRKERERVARAPEEAREQQTRRDDGARAPLAREAVHDGDVARVRAQPRVDVHRGAREQRQRRRVVVRERAPGAHAPAKLGRVVPAARQVVHRVVLAVVVPQRRRHLAVAAAGQRSFVKPLEIITQGIEQGNFVEAFGRKLA